MSLTYNVVNFMTVVSIPDRQKMVPTHEDRHHFQIKYKVY